MTGSRTPACPPRYGLDRGEHATAHNVLNIPSSRLDQHGAHDAALKAVRPRLRLRALRLDRDAAHPPPQTRPERQEKRSSTTSRRTLTGPAASWMTPRLDQDVYARRPKCSELQELSQQTFVDRQVSGAVAVSVAVKPRRRSARLSGVGPEGPTRDGEVAHAAVD